jgi:D-arginine dehydrogenase
VKDSITHDRLALDVEFQIGQEWPEFSDRRNPISDMSKIFDIVVVGGGIAGFSVAAELSAEHNVCVVERETAAGYHSTGRSAATFVPNYGPAPIQALAKASEAFFDSAPNDFAESPLLNPRGEAMMIAPGEETHIAEGEALGLRLMPLDELRTRVPLLRRDALVAAMIDESARDLDVDLLLQGYIKLFKARGGTVMTEAEVTGFTRHYGAWQVQTSAGDLSCAMVVNAAGAWATPVAKLAGAQEIEITPKRRSAMLLDMPDGVDLTQWPLCFCAGEAFYFKPMGGKLMLSPADATPVEPHDAWADDMALAEAVEKFQNVIDFEVTHAGSTWGGLRSFTADGSPVAGFDEAQDNFFWLAGQGGYGIQTAPAMARLAAALVNGRHLPDDIVFAGLEIDAVSPARFNK